MITAEVSLHVASTVTGRTGNWSWTTTMNFAVVPPEGSYIIWERPDGDGEITDRVRRVYYYSWTTKGDRLEDVAIDLDWLTTDSPDVLNEAFELHKDWKQLGGPWAGQEESSGGH